MNIDYYIDAALQNNSVLSRTVNGTYDATASVEKPHLTIAQQQLPDIARMNLTKSITAVHDQRELHSSDVAPFVRKIASYMNNSIVVEQFFRTHEIPSEHAYGYPVETLPEEFERFCAWFHSQQPQDEEESLRSLAMAELAFETAHFLGDGCGRTGRTISLLFPMRVEGRVKRITDRTEYYQQMGAKRDPDALYDETSALPFIEYYQALPWIEP